MDHQTTFLHQIMARYPGKQVLVISSTRPLHVPKSSMLRAPVNFYFTPVGYRIGRGRHAVVFELNYPFQLMLGYRKKLGVRN